MNRRSDNRHVDIDNARRAEAQYGRGYDHRYHGSIVHNVRRNWRDATGNDDIARLTDEQVYACNRYAAGFNPEDVGLEHEDDVDLAVCDGTLQVDE